MINERGNLFSALNSTYLIWYHSENYMFCTFFCIFCVTNIRRFFFSHTRQSVWYRFGECDTFSLIQFKGNCRKSDCSQRAQCVAQQLKKSLHGIYEEFIGESLETPGIVKIYCSTLEAVTKPWFEMFSSVRAKCHPDVKGIGWQMMQVSISLLYIPANLIALFPVRAYCMSAIFLRESAVQRSS